MEVRGRVALVTGASSGIGAAIALRLAAAGARVVVHGRDEVRATAVADDTGGTVLLGDLAVPGVAESIASRAAERGAVDILVANAGLGWCGAFTEMPPDQVDRLVAVDLLAPIRLARALVPPMVERGRGHVVLVGSVAGHTGVAGEAVYAAAKAGLGVFAESLRLELDGSGVGVSVVVPSAVRTRFFGARGEPYGRRLPRPVAADDVAGATLNAILEQRPEVWLPRWVRAATVVRAVAPSAFRRLSTRYGEQVRSVAREEARR